MNKAELIDAIAAETGLTKVNSKKALELLLMQQARHLQRATALLL